MKTNLHPNCRIVLYPHCKEACWFYKGQHIPDSYCRRRCPFRFDKDGKPLKPEDFDDKLTTH